VWGAIFIVWNWRIVAVVLAAFSILANIEWVVLPFSFYGLLGRPRVLYGSYSLIQTFSFHPLGWVWWVLFGLQIFGILVASTGTVAPERIVRVITFALPAIGLLLLDTYFALRWGAPSLWKMYAIGAVPGILLLGSSLCNIASTSR
jgi:hypothetical protein